MRISGNLDSRVAVETDVFCLNFCTDLRCHDQTDTDDDLQAETTKVVVSSGSTCEVLRSEAGE